MLCSRHASHTILLYYFRDLSAAPCYGTTRPVSHSSISYCGSVTNIRVSRIITNKNIMANKVFLNRERTIPTGETLSVSREDKPSTTRNILES